MSLYFYSLLNTHMYIAIDMHETDNRENTQILSLFLFLFSPSLSLHTHTHTHIHTHTHTHTHTNTHTHTHTHTYIYIYIQREREIFLLAMMNAGFLESLLGMFVYPFKPASTCISQPDFSFKHSNIDFRHLIFICSAKKTRHTLIPSAIVVKLFSHSARLSLSVCHQLAFTVPSNTCK